MSDGQSSDWTQKRLGRIFDDDEPRLMTWHTDDLRLVLNALWFQGDEQEAAGQPDEHLEHVFGLFAAELDRRGEPVDG